MILKFVSSLITLRRPGYAFIYCYKNCHSPRSVIPSTITLLSTSIQSGTLSAQLTSPSHVPKKIKRSSPPGRLPTSGSSPSSIDHKKINIPTSYHHPTINTAINNKDRREDNTRWLCPIGSFYPKCQ